MMKKIILFSILLPSFLFAQKTLKLANFTEIIIVSDVPDDKLPKGAENIVFLQSYSDTGSVIYLGYTINEEDVKVLTKFQQDAEWFNSSKSDTRFANDTITLWTQQPFRATEIVYQVLYKNKKAKFISSTWYDPSSEAIELAEKALAEGKIKVAIEYYYTVQYPSSYMNEEQVGLQILSKANKVGLSFSDNKMYSDAALVMEYALDYYGLYAFTEPEDEAGIKKGFEDEYLTEYTDSFGLWMGNYGYFLYKADSLQKSIEVNRKTNKTYPNLSGPYLQRGDALFDLGKKTEAKPIYMKYMALMRQKGKADGIPQRVYDRVK
jgi:hypothetical protein